MSEKLLFIGITLIIIALPWALIRFWASRKLAAIASGKPLKNIKKKKNSLEWAIDDDGITKLSNKPVKMRWSDLEGVSIVTTDEGPMADDYFWVLRDPTQSILVPIGAATEINLLSYLQKLPGFDNGAVMQSAGSTKNAIFQCWEKEERKISKKH